MSETELEEGLKSLAKRKTPGGRKGQTLPETVRGSTEYTKLTIRSVFLAYVGRGSFLVEQKGLRGYLKPEERRSS